MDDSVLTHHLFDDLWPGLETYIGFGFTPWRGLLEWVPEVARRSGTSPEVAEDHLWELWLAQMRRQESWHDTTDGDRLDEALRHVRQHGVYTAAAWGCCDYCHPSAPIPSQDGSLWGEAVIHGYSLPLLMRGILPIKYGLPSWSEWETDEETYMRVADLLVPALRSQGLEVDWDGEPGGVIDIHSTDWRHRMPS